MTDSDTTPQGRAYWSHPARRTQTYFDPGAGERRQRAYHIIFESDSRAGHWFDVALIGVILASVLAVVLESIPEVQGRIESWLVTAEWMFTALFTLEYLVRLWCVRRPLLYARSFFGIIDLLSALPSFIGLLVPQGRYLMIVRVLRLLRIFRILKLTHYVDEANTLVRALRASSRKIGIFVYTVITLVIVIGSAMYVIEGPDSGFTSIPRGVYWSIVTLTTVGYGDIAPQTPLGQLFASVVMILGYAIIAVPTGIVTSELTRIQENPRLELHCGVCHTELPVVDATYCHHCGTLLRPEDEPER